MTALAGVPGSPGTPEVRGGADIAVVLGTRPEVIKLAPVIAALGRRARVIWTGQHYDRLMVDIFFEQLGWPVPEERLTGVGGGARGQQVVAVMAGLIDCFARRRPAVVVVQGDTNTTNAAAQAAYYSGIPVVHVEAGLRSFDRDMPEEINRLIVGSVATLHCCATQDNAAHLRRAGVADSSIRVTGNTIVEATLASLPAPAEQSRVLGSYGLGSEEYVLATIHRPENTDNPERLRCVLDALDRIGLPVLLPIHPRTAAAVARLGACAGAGLRLVDPVDHPTFLALEANARLIVSDSGGVQEEVTVLKRPLVVVRNSTERPESIDAGFAVLTQPAGVVEASRRLLDPAIRTRLLTTASPFGDGHAARRIAAETRALARTGLNGRFGDSPGRRLRWHRAPAQPAASRWPAPAEAATTARLG